MPHISFSQFSHFVETGLSITPVVCGALQHDGTSICSRVSLQPCSILLRERPPQRAADRGQQTEGSRQRAADRGQQLPYHRRRVQLKAVRLNLQLFNRRPSRSAKARVYVCLHMDTSASGQFILPYGPLAAHRTADRNSSHPCPSYEPGLQLGDTLSNSQH